MVINLTEDTSCNWKWIDVLDPESEDFKNIAREFQLHPAVVADSQQPNHLPKLEHIGETTFAIIRIFDKQVSPAGDTVQDLTNKLAIFYSEKYLITVHKFEYGFFQTIQEQYIHTGQCEKPFHLFLQLIKEAINSFDGPALELASELDLYESKVFLQKNYRNPLTNDIYWLKRKAEVSKRVLLLSKTVLDNLTRTEERNPEVQDVHDTYVRVLNMYEEIDNSTNNLLNIYIGLASQRTNEIMRVLTIFSAFFLPLTFLAGIYGMNFIYMPELKERLGYPATIAAMLFITAGIYLWFKKRGWL